MVGFFSGFSVKGSHSRAQSVLDERAALRPALDATSGSTAASASAATHGIEIAVEFKPVERPSEPLDNDQPIQCPFPEPSILNDGRLWKERVSSGIERGADTPDVQEQTPREQLTKPRPPSNRVILPSVSAPEHNILKLLDECNSSGLQYITDYCTWDRPSVSFLFFSHLLYLLYFRIT